MTTPLDALDRAMRTGQNPTEVLARLGDQGFLVVNQAALLESATQVFRFMSGITQPEAVAKTVIHASLAGAAVLGMLGDE